MDQRSHHESPVVAYALATSALLLAALLMCLCLLCCAKCPDWRRQRRIKAHRYRLLKRCKKVKYRFKPTNPDMAVSESCAVCLDEFEESESILLCPCSCKHGYHKKCIGDWLVETPVCPICKKTVLPPSTETTPLLHSNA